MKRYILPLAVLGAAALTSCSNEDISFADYDKTATYFAQQQPVRTITMGDDAVAVNELDNLKQFEIKAVMGGVYTNTKNRVIEYAIDPKLCDGLKFEDGTDVTPLPSNYYQMADAKNLTIPAGQIIGGTKVQLTDAFFEDPLATTVHYVLPIKLVATADVDTILESQNYTLYALKYKNKYHGVWLSRGVDKVNNAGTTTTTVRHAQFIEKDELREIGTERLNKALYNVSFNLGASTAACELLLTFDASDKCTITSNTAGVTVTGSGVWERQAAKKAWGDTDRDQMILSYKIDFGGNVTTESADTLVMRDRQSKFETFKLAE